MLKLKHLGTGVLFFAPIVSMAGPLESFQSIPFSFEDSSHTSRIIVRNEKSKEIILQLSKLPQISSHVPNLGEIIQDSITQVTDRVIVKTFSNTNGISTSTITQVYPTTQNENKESRFIKFDDFKKYAQKLNPFKKNDKNKTPTNNESEITQTKLDTFKFQPELFSVNLEKAKEYYFISQQCQLFNDDQSIADSIESILLGYHYLNYLYTHKNQSLSSDVDYFSEEKSSKIKESYYQEKLKLNSPYDCGADNLTYNTQIIKTFVEQNLLEFERVESIITNRLLNVKFQQSPDTALLEQEFDINLIKNNLRKYPEIINNIVAVKYCPWEVKDSIQIDKLLKDSSKVVSAFGNVTFKQHWQARKSLNYVLTYQSLLKYSISHKNENFCNDSKQILKQLNYSYRKI